MRTWKLLTTVTVFWVFLPAFALAGGVIVTLDGTPSDLRAGVPLAVGFTIVSMHTGQPEAGYAPEVRAVNAATGERFTAPGVPEGAPGHYLAALLFPSPGEWRWEIHPYGAAAGDYPASVLAPLRVRSAAADDAPPGDTPADTPADAALGAALFLDKGCVSCHENARVAGNTVSDVAPDLTRYAGGAAFLRRWLADPGAVRPGATMPALSLSAREIEALVAFLGAPR